MADWSDWPMNNDVFWQKDEKIIGVLGLCPVATADFYTKLVSRVTKKDWLYPRVLLDINSKIPSRGRFFSLGETDPVPYIKKGIEELSFRGADFVVIPCNTAHALYDRFACNLPVPVPNILDITTISAIKQGVKRPLILGTSTTREQKLYEETFAHFDIEIIHFPEQKLISEGIEAVKQNLDSLNTAKTICGIIDTFHNIDSVIFGCTEISVLMNPIRLSHFTKNIVIDSNQELAEFCMDFISSSTIDSRIRMFA